MPIRPENQERYPPSWREISERIRFERAGGQCECRGECGTDHKAEALDMWCDERTGDERCAAMNGRLHPITRSSVVLTVAHLDHTPENCEDDNLKAMCQRCHNAYDAPERRAGIQKREREKRAVGDLFGGGE